MCCTYSPAVTSGALLHFKFHWLSRAARDEAKLTGLAEISAICSTEAAKAARLKTVYIFSMLSKTKMPVKMPSTSKKINTTPSVTMIIDGSWSISLKLLSSIKSVLQAQLNANRSQKH